MTNNKRDVRLQVFVTASVDDKISDMAEIMGINKNDVVRMAIAQYIASYETTVQMIKNEVQEELGRKKA